MKPQHHAKAVLIVAATLAVALGAASGAAAAPDVSPDVSPNATAISSCTTIESPGEYALAGDLTGAPDGACLVVAADGVTVDGNGHEIAANGTSARGPAVRAADAEGVAVRNVSLSGWQIGVTLDGVDGATVSDVRVSGADVVGMSVEGGSWNVTVAGVDVRDGTGGVRFDGASDVEVRDSAFSALTGTAVRVRGDGTDATVRNVSVSDTSGVGVRVTGGDGVTVVDSDVSDVASHGIAVDDASAVTIEGNRLDGTSGVGIRVRGSPGTRTSDNVVTDTLSGGIQYVDSGHEVRRVDSVERRWPQLSRMFGAPRGATGGARGSLAMQYPSSDRPLRDAVVTNNTVDGGYNHGVLVESTTGIIVSANRLERNDDGVHASNSSDVSVWRNVLRLNLDDGVAFGRVSDGEIRSNNATENGDNGFYVVGNDNLLADNTALLNGDDGIDIQNATGSLVRRNVAARNGDDGIFLRNANNGTLTDNVVRDNRDDGIHIDRSAGNVVTELAACGNDDEAVMRAASARNNEVALVACESAD